MWIPSSCSNKSPCPWTWSCITLDTAFHKSSVLKYFYEEGRSKNLSCLFVNDTSTSLHPRRYIISPDAALVCSQMKCNPCASPRLAFHHLIDRKQQPYPAYSFAKHFLPCCIDMLGEYKLAELSIFYLTHFLKKCLRIMNHFLKVPGSLLVFVTIMFCSVVAIDVLHVPLTKLY